MSLLRRLTGRREPQESSYAFKKLMAMAAKDIAERGEIRPARVIDKGPNRAKTHIGWKLRQLLRGEFRRRA